MVMEETSMQSAFVSKIFEVLVCIVSLDYFFVKKVIREFFGQSSEGRGKTILDLGCGTGILAPLFPKNGYLGVDIVNELIEYAKNQHPGYSFRAVDATKLRLGKKFDYIMVVGVIHHLDDSQVKKFIETIDIHLKKDGRALIIEAIPPIFKWNLLGTINRKMDRGAYIRRLDDYVRFAESKLKIERSYNQFGGVADYGVLVVSKK